MLYLLFVRPELDVGWIASVTGASRARREQRIQSLWSGYGEIVRVALEDAPHPSVVVKWVTPERRPPSDVGHARKRRSYDVERRFYERFASRTTAACRVPALLGSRKASEPAEEWLFVLEDLDGAGFSSAGSSSSSAGLDRCVAWLAAFHATFMGVAPDGLWKEGTYWHLATRREEVGAIGDRALRDAAPVIDAKLAACRHRTLVHGDAKRANFCFGHRAVAAVDFQYVGGGSGMRDVAYLLGGEPDEARLLETYFAHLRAALGASASAVEEEWRALYPYACADFYRFLAGWAPSHYRSDAHAQRVVRDVIARL